jgi:hypothetical protein
MCLSSKQERKDEVGCRMRALDCVFMVCRVRVCCIQELLPVYVRKCMESLSTGEAVVTSLQVARAIIEVLPSFTTYDAGTCAASSHGRSVAWSSGTPYPIPYTCPLSQFVCCCFCGSIYIL